MVIVFIIYLLILFCLAFDLGRKWERMEWDGSFDQETAAQLRLQADAEFLAQKGNIKWADCSTERRS